jgi:hypothetical protein
MRNFISPTYITLDCVIENPHDWPSTQERRRRRGHPDRGCRRRRIRIGGTLRTR